MKLDLYFGDEHITSLMELGQKMYLYPNQAYSFVMRSDFLEDLKNEEPILFYKLQPLLDIEDDHIFLFKVSYLFCRFMTLRYNEHSFESLKELGEKIIYFGPVIDVYLEDILKYKLLSYVMSLQEKDKLHPREFERILEIEQMYEENSALAYFTLGFHLSEFKVIIYKGKPYINPKLFFEYICCDINITEFAMEFEKNQYVFAWLKYLGYEQELLHYHNLVELIVSKENNK